VTACVIAAGEVGGGLDSELNEGRLPRNLPEATGRSPRL
jgi:hypothetical protein